MPRAANRYAALFGVVVLATAVAATAGPAVAARTSGSPRAAAGRAAIGGPSHQAPNRPADLDTRQPTTAAGRHQATLRSEQLKARTPVHQLATALGQQGIVDIDPMTGTPRQVAKLDGLLTGASKATARSVAIRYVRDHSAAFGLSAKDIDGLHLSHDYVDIDGTNHLSFTQSADGLTLFGNGLKANVTQDGRLINLTGAPVHDLGLPAPLARAIGSGTAIRAAKRSAGEATLTRGPADTAKQVLFETAAGPRRAWQTVTMSAANPALSIVDAGTGSVLYRDLLGSDLVSAAASAKPAPRSANVWTNYPGATAGGTAHVVGLTSKKWLAAGAKTLSGNNVHTYTDINGNGHAGKSEEVKPTGTQGYRFKLNRVKVSGEPCTTNVCTWHPTTPFSWRAKSNASRTATQNFYFINNWHDYLAKAPIGFTEAAGNFQKVNKTGKGKGGDAVKDEALSGAAVDDGLPNEDFIDNADFDTPPDGQAPTMRMFLFHEPFSGKSDPLLPVAGSDSADIVYHEYTHGLSHRLITDATNNPALDSTQGSSMGEAWSDWYALDYLADQHLVPNTSSPDVIVGRYVEGAANKTGIRSMPMDCPVGSTAAVCKGVQGTGGGGYTYGDLKTLWDKTQDEHTMGEIWGQTLWDLRTAVGSSLAESLVTRGMELSPTFPSMLDMRNAILQADLADHSANDVSTLWAVFAHRGMGFFASSQTGDDTAPVESFVVPPAAGSPTGTLIGTVTNATGGGLLAGVTIGVSGHDSGFPGDYVTKTGTDGQYSLSGLVPGSYPSVYAAGGVDRVTRAVTIAVGPNVQNWSVQRDWSASSGGAKVSGFTGIDLTAAGCGPKDLIDSSGTTGWASSNVNGAPYVIVKLPEAVDVTTFGVNPSAVCGDGDDFALRNYRLQTSADGVTWRTASSGTFHLADLDRLNTVTPAAGSTAATRWVRLTLLTPQSSGEFAVDAAELETYGTPSAGLPDRNHQGGHPPVPR